MISSLRTIFFCTVVATLSFGIVPSLNAKNLWPQECSSTQPDTTTDDNGQPVYFRNIDGLIWGISTKTVPYGQAITMILWLCNTTDRQLSVRTCSDIGRFWLEGIDVLDSSGRRVSRLHEETFCGDIVCFNNGSLRIPPHMSLHGTFAKSSGDLSLDLRNRDLSVDLRQYYSLPPATYFVVPSSLGLNCETANTNRPLDATLAGLKLVIAKPQD